VIIFATLFCIGFLLLIFSLIFGHDFDHDVDHGFDGDAHGPSIFSVRMIALLMVGFGAVSFGFRATTKATMFQSSMAGVGGAIVIGAVGYLIIRAFYVSQASSTITNQDIVGCTATLIDAISEKDNGQVSCILRGREITYLARSKDGKSIAKGTPVKIISRSGNFVTVEPVE
jgi:membrane protein implicated in regulation of membrane protease activity